MKTAKVEASADIKLGGEPATVKIIFEIPYPEYVFQKGDRAEEMKRMS